MSRLKPKIEIDITISDKRWNDTVSDIETITDNAIKTTISKISPKAQNIEISIVLADDTFIKELNKNYRGKNKATNVLSFPLSEKSDFETEENFISLGDIIIAFETIKSQAQEQNKSIHNHYLHMLIHGCLHLMHYDHLTDIEAQKMENLEIEILKIMDIKNPYEIS